MMKSGKHRLVLAPFIALLLMATVVGAVLADDIVVPGTEVVIPLPPLDLPEVVPVDTLAPENLVPTVEEVTTTVVPEAVETIVPAPTTPAPEVPAVVTTATEQAADAIGNLPVPDLRGDVPELPVAVPTVSEIAQQAEPLIAMVKSLIPAEAYPSMGLIASTVYNIVEMLPSQLTDIPLIRSLIDLLMTILTPPAGPATSVTIDPPGDSPGVVAPATTYSPTATPTEVAAASSADPSYDHLPYTGMDLSMALFSILGMAAALFAVRRFEAWLIARR